MVIVGIDPSLSSTGLCLLDSDLHSTCYNIKTTPTMGHHGTRCFHIADRIRDYVLAALDTDSHVCCFIEEPMNLKSNAQDLRALFWYIVNGLQETNGYGTVDVYAASPQTLYKFLTNKGQTAAVNKVVAVQKRYSHLIPPEFMVDYDTKGGIEAHADVYDAIGLAALGHCYLGGEGFTKAQLETVTTVSKL